MAAEVGDRTWAHVSGLGKVLLAWGNDDAIELVLRERGLPALTDRTIVDRATLDVELERIRSRGYAIDDEESAYGLRCVAAPVRDGRGAVVGALSLSSPAERLSLKAAEQAQQASSALEKAHSATTRTEQDFNTAQANLDRYNQQLASALEESRRRMRRR